jgi:Uma2 family endonuclease
MAMTAIVEEIEEALETKPARWLWTKDQYYQIAELGIFNDIRVELVEGEIYRLSPIGKRHWVSVLLVTEVLRKLTGENQLVVSQNSMDMGESSELEPDVSVIVGSPRDYLIGLPTDAELVVEVSDTSLKYDRETKSGLYARAGIADYWIVNLPENCLEVRRRPAPIENSRFGFDYQEVIVLKREDRIAPLFAPDSPIAVAGLLP